MSQPFLAVPNPAQSNFNYTITTSAPKYDLKGCKNMLGNITLDELHSLPKNISEKWVKLLDLFTALVGESDDEDEEDEKTHSN